MPALCAILPLKLHSATSAQARFLPTIPPRYAVFLKSLNATPSTVTFRIVPSPSLLWAIPLFSPAAAPTVSLPENVLSIFGTWFTTVLSASPSFPRMPLFIPVIPPAISAFPDKITPVYGTLAYRRAFPAAVVSSSFLSPLPWFTAQTAPMASTPLLLMVRVC